ncbi:MAG TPA: MATE family efflux transporter [Longimicrobiales bacterium]
MAGQHDLTTGAITRHLLKTMSFMLVTMAFQTLYYIVDLYWVGKLGTAPVAAVGLAGNFTFIVLALTQMLGVGTTTVVSHAVGRKDYAQALLLFNQSQVLAMITGLLFLIVGMLLRMPYANAMSADPQTAQLVGQYLLWFIPAMALQFLIVAMGAALRAAGNFKPSMVVGSGSVVINMILAPFLIFGWGTGKAFGVAGAAMSSLIAIVIAIFWLASYFKREEFLRIEVHTWKPRLDTWKRMLAIGVPTGFEFVMSSVYMFLVYAALRQFGAAAQAAFGIGMRVVQACFMPVVALGFSVAPVAGQNFGALLAERVKRTFKDGALMAAGMMFLLAVLCKVWPTQMVSVFSNDPQVIAHGAEYLRIVSWNFIPSGLIFVASSMFQAMGNTMPSLISSATRITLIAIPLAYLARQPGFQMEWIWYLSVATVVVQMALSLWLLRREFAIRLREIPEPVLT